MLKPKLKGHYDIVPAGRDRLQARSSESVFSLSGKTIEEIFKELLPLLNGEFTVDEIVEKLDRIAEPNLVRATLQKLEESMLIEDASSKSDAGLGPEVLERYQKQLTFFATATDWGTELENQKALMEASVAIIGDGELAERLGSELLRAGIGSLRGVNLFCSEQGGPGQEGSSFRGLGISLDDMKSAEEAVIADRPRVLVLAFDRPEPALLEPLNRLSQDQNIPLLLCQLNGTEGIVGPFIVPGQTACLLCHHLRVTRNLDFFKEYRVWENWVKGDGHERRSGYGVLGGFAAVIAGLGSLEIIKTTSGFHEPELYGRFLTVNALTFEVLSHPLLRLPRCPGCGNSRGTATRTPWLEKR